MWILRKFVLFSPFTIELRAQVPRPPAPTIVRWPEGFLCGSGNVKRMTGNLGCVFSSPPDTFSFLRSSCTNGVSSSKRINTRLCPVPSFTERMLMWESIPSSWKSRWLILPFMDGSFTRTFTETETFGTSTGV